MDPYCRQIILFMYLKACLIFSTSPIIFAHAYESVSSLPNYSFEFVNPYDDNCGAYLVFRLYDPYLNENETNSSPVPIMDIHFDDGSTQYNISFPYQFSYNFSDPSTYYGQVTYGEDQYATYYYNDLTHISNSTHKVIGVSANGILPRVNYFNMKYEFENAMNGNCPHKSKIVPSMLVATVDLSDDEMTWNVPNPYLPGNLSTVAYYENSLDHSIFGHSYRESDQVPRQEVVRSNIVDNGENSYDELTSLSSSSSSLAPLNVYRLDAFLSNISQPDGHSDTKCSDTYLFANVYNTSTIASCEKPNVQMLYQYGIMEIKIPYSFNVYDNNETIFGDYDVRYFSVGSHLCTVGDLLPFWTVNNRMMYDFLNASSSQSIAGNSFYVFFAPIDQVREYALNSPEGLTSKPPFYQWGIYSGLLLATPDFNFIFRYRVPNSNWKGSPNNYPCFKTPRTNQPINRNPWIPEIFGDNFDSFEDFQNTDTIGPVSATGGGWI